MSADDREGALGLLIHAAEELSVAGELWDDTLPGQIGQVFRELSFPDNLGKDGQQSSETEAMRLLAIRCPTASKAASLALCSLLALIQF